MKKKFIRFLHSMGLGKSFDIEKWAIEQTGAALTPNPIMYKPSGPTQDEIDRKVIEDARREAANRLEWLEQRKRDAKITQLLEKINALSDRPLTVDDRIELDRLIYGIAYYRTVNGVKERLDPLTVTTLTLNPHSL